MWTNRAFLYLDMSRGGAGHVVVGFVLLAGIGVSSGNVRTCAVGVIAAGVSLIVNFFFIPASPIWPLVVVTIDVLVIWALTAHGKEMRQT